MLHHYVQKGWKIEEFLAAPMLEELFYKASMDAALEDRGRLLAELFGGGD